VKTDWERMMTQNLQLVINNWCVNILSIVGLYTRKNAQVVTNLQQTCAVLTTCQQNVFALLVDKLSTTCWQLAIQGSWAQQTCYKLFEQLVIVLQFNNLSTSCEWQPCSDLIK
jgi:hypothetical protein